MRQIFQLDVRGLAFFRIGLGLLVLLKLVYLLPNLELVLGWDGLIPVDLLPEVSRPPWSILSAYVYPTAAWSLYGLTLFHILVAAMFIVGWHTRTIAVILWVLCVSLDARNPFIMNGGDRLLTILLFWSIFLPLNKAYAFDACRQPAQPNSPLAAWFFSFGCACLVLQTVALYLISGYLKTHPVWNVDFTAVEYSMRNEAYSTDLGKLLLGVPLLLKGFTVITIYLEQVFIVLLLWPFYNTAIRIGLAVFYILLHVGIALTLNIGFFPYCCILLWIALLPARFYDHFLPESRLPIGFFATPNLHPSKDSYICAICFVFYLALGSLNQEKPSTALWVAKAPIRVLKLNQRWQLYAPHPGFSTRWVSIVATDHQGQLHLLYPWPEKDSPTPFADTPQTTYPTFYLRKFWSRIIGTNNHAISETALKALARHRMSTDQYTQIENISLVLWKKPSSVQPVQQQAALYQRSVFFSTSFATGEDIIPTSSPDQEVEME